MTRVKVTYLNGTIEYYKKILNMGTNAFGFYGKARVNPPTEGDHFNDYLIYVSFNELLKVEIEIVTTIEIPVRE